MFLFTLSNGVKSIQAVEVENINGMDFNTAPGAKILIKSAVTVCEGVALLSNSNCKYMGGKVEEMYEKWITRKVHIYFNINYLRGYSLLIPS